VRTVKTTSGATAVQVVWSSRQVEHLGWAHDEGDLAAFEGRRGGADRCWSGRARPEVGHRCRCGPLEIVGSRAGHLWDALCRAYDALAAGGDEVFRALVLTRIIEPTSKLDSLRVLAETVLVRRPTRRSSVDCPVTESPCGARTSPPRARKHAALGPASLVLYDVSVRHEALVCSSGGERPPPRPVP